MKACCKLYLIAGNIHWCQCEFGVHGSKNEIIVGGEEG
jgi:hypothetical protein